MNKAGIKQIAMLAFMTLCVTVFMSTMIFGVCLAATSPRIILLETFDVPVVLEHTRFFLRAMEKLGYHKENILILKAQGDPARAKLLLREEINRKKPDVIVTNATVASQITYPISKAEKIPMVFFVVSDPVGAGIISELDVPSHEFISGVVHSVPRDTKIEMVMRIINPLKPGNRPVRFGYIYSSYPSAVGDLKMLEEAARKRGDLEFFSYQIPYDEKHFNINQAMSHLIKGIDKLESKIDYWWISQDPVGELKEFVQTILKHSKHPVVCGTNAGSTKSGSLVHIAADTETGAQETALIVDSILKGADVGTISVHSPSKIDFGVNLSTAVKMGVAIPSDLLELAGPKIFK